MVAWKRLLIGNWKEWTIAGIIFAVWAYHDASTSVVSPKKVDLSHDCFSDKEREEWNAKVKATSQLYPQKVSQVITETESSQFK